MAGTATRFSSYDEVCAQHTWDVPERYNIAEDVCDKHPRGQARDDPRGLPTATCARSAGASSRRTSQPLRERPARARRREGRPRRDAAAADARDGRRVLRHVEVRRDPALDVGPLRRRRHPPPRQRLAGQGPGHQRARTRRASTRRWSSTSCCSTTSLLERRRRHLRARGHARRRPRAALLLVRHDGPGQGHPPRAPLPARARGVPLLPRRPGRRAASTAWASGRGRRASRRCSARGGSARSSSSTSARAASTRTSSSTCCRATARRTCSRRRRRCAR